MIPVMYSGLCFPIDTNITKQTKNIKTPKYYSLEIMSKLLQQHKDMAKQMFSIAK